MNDPSTDSGRRIISKAMSDTLLKADNEILLDKYAQKTAMRLGVAADSVRKEFKKRSRAQEDSSEEYFESENETETPPPSIQEVTLLKLLLHSEDHVEWAKNILNLDWISHPNVREIVSRRFTLHDSGEWHGPAAFLADLESADSRTLITQVLAEDRPIAEPEKVLKGYLGKQGIMEFLRDKFIDRQSASLIQQMSKPNLSDEEQVRLWKQKQELMELKKQSLGRLK